MDGHFGLPRKKAAGKSYREPLLNDIFFKDQSLVDQFLADNEEVKSRSQVSWVTFFTLTSIWTNGFI